MIARATTLVSAGLLVGCTQGADRSAEPSRNYVSGDSTATELPLGGRGDPIEFSGAPEGGEITRSENYLRDVLVVNFWYATCPPSRLEAPCLEEFNQKYAADGVQFHGVNIPSIIGGATLIILGMLMVTGVWSALILSLQGAVGSFVTVA